MSDSTVVGLHVSGSALRCAKVRRVVGRVEVVTLQRAAWPGREPAGAAEALDLSSGQRTGTGSGATLCGITSETAPGQTATDPTTTVASMPGPDVMTRCWSLPKTDATRFSQMVAHRLEADLPVPMEELVWGCRSGEPDPSGGSTTHVLAQAARRDKVAGHMAALSALHLDVDALTTEAEALAALYRHGLGQSRRRGTDVLVLATAEEWLIAVLTGGVVRSVRHVPTAPDQLELICRECRQTIEAEEPVHRLQRVLWCSSPELADARELLADRLQVAVEPVRPVVKLGGGGIDHGELASFGPAIGLALAGLFERDRIIRFAGREVAPAPGRYPRLERALSHPWRWTGTAAALLVLGCLVYVGAMAWETRRMNRLLADHDQSKSVSAEVESKRRRMEQIRAYRIDVEGIIADLCARIPGSIVISSVQLSRERGLIIKGTAGKPKEIFKLAEDLQKSNSFTNVQPGRTEPGRSNAFTIKADVTGITKLFSASVRGGRWR